MENKVDVSVILRPRRFGKSTNLSMLKSFLSRGVDRETFKDLAIYNDEDFMSQHCGKYSVVHLDLKGCKSDTFEEMKTFVWEQLKLTLSEHYNEMPEKIPNYNPSNEDLANLPMPVNLLHRLRHFMQILYEKFGTRIIVLIDEYDAPLNHAFQMNYYAQAARFFESFFSVVLKGNEVLGKACLMGIVEIQGEGILSGFNNTRAYSIADEKFSQFFGFTLDEIRPFAKDSFDDVIGWYNGYTIGQFKMINPWSFSRWLEKDVLESYWVDTGNLLSLSSIVADGINDIFAEVIQLTVEEGFKKQIKPLSTKVRYTNLFWDNSSIWHFFILLGYLSYDVDPKNRDICYASIPNEELRRHWKTEMKTILGRSNALKFSGLSNALADFNTESTHEILEEIINLPSHYDFRSENSYHMLLFGTFSVLLDDNITSKLYSNLESGKGRFDIAVEFLKENKVVIFELKKSNDVKNLEKDAQKALTQIVKSNYAASYKGQRCQLVGVSFCGKNISSLKSKIVIGGSKAKVEEFSPKVGLNLRKRKVIKNDEEEEGLLSKKRKTR